MYVIGTAGHVDHGKSSLIQALSGINPDRLQEELERGLTIELGFAWLSLPSKREISIVDVPGHVRFVKHMLAGIGAVDLVLLVIAADEGVMPQTKEHLEIIDLLEVRHAIVALTKTDIADEEWTMLVEGEVRELLDNTSIDGAPIVQVSSVTGYGLDELLRVLDETLVNVPEPVDIDRPRLGIDRVFTMQGFGTVVTGTLLGGRLSIGDTLEAVPDGPTARIRGLQTHQQEVEEALPGTRVAVNLAGVSTDDLGRGQVLTKPGSMLRVQAFDLRIRMVTGRALTHNLRVAVHTGAAEAQGRVRILADDKIESGKEGWAQVVLRSPLACATGDLVVLRVSDQTIGGGRIVSTNPPRHRRRDMALLDRLDSLATNTPESKLLTQIESVEPTNLPDLIKTVELKASDIQKALDNLVKDGSVVAITAGQAGASPIYLTKTRLEILRQETKSTLDAYHKEFPLRFTMPREELRSRLNLEQRDFAAVLVELELEFTSSGDGISESDWAPIPTAAQENNREEILRLLSNAGLQPPRLSHDPELLAYLVANGEIVDCGNDVLISIDTLADAEHSVRALLADGKQLSLAEARDALGTNRRVTQAILETLDARGITRREGEVRVLTPSEKANPLLSENPSPEHSNS